MARFNIEINIGLKGAGATEVNAALKKMAGAATEADRGLQGLNQATSRTGTEAQRAAALSRQQASAISDLIAKTRQHNQALLRDIAAAKQGTAATRALANARELERRMAEAGVTAETALGKALKAQIELEQKLAAELKKVQAEQARSATAAREQARAAAEAQREAAESRRAMLQNALQIAGAALVAGVVTVLRQMIAAQREAQQVEAQLNAALQSTGSAAGLTAAQLLALAAAKSKQTGLDDEMIAGAEGVLLRYNRIGKEIFPRVVDAALDLAAATGMDLNSAMEKVGKIVNTPLRGLMALQKEGYAVSASQEKLVKDLLRTGDIAGAQAEMLKILERQYGGTAAAARDTLGGAFTALGTSWENLLERMSEDSMSPVRQGLEAVISLLEAITENWGYVELGAANVRAGILSLKVDALVLADAFLRAARAALELARSIPGAGVGADAMIKGIDTRIGANQASIARAQSEAMSAVGRAMGRVLYEQGKISEEAARKLGILTDSHRKAGVAAKEQTNAEAELGKKQAELAKQVVETAQSLALAVTQNLRLAEIYRRLAATSSMSWRDYSPQGQNPREVEAALRAQALENAYLEDKKRFGEKAAEALRGLRAAQYDSAQAAQKAKVAYDQLQQSLKTLAEWSDRAAAARAQADYERNRQRLLGGPVADRFAEVSVYRSGAAINPDVVEDIFRVVRERAEEFARGVRASLLSIADAYALEKKRIEGLVKLGPEIGLTAAEGAEAIRRLEQQRWNDALSLTDQALGYLADKFGGFFKHLRDLVNSIQQARAFGQSVTGAIQGAAQPGSALANYAGLIGNVATVFAVYYAIYTEVDKYLKAQRLKKFGQVNTFSIKGGLDQIGLFDNSETGRLDEWGRAFAKSMRGLVQSIEDTLGITIRDLTGLSIKFRNDGKQVRAYVEGQFIGLFSSVEEAVQAAMVAALRSANTHMAGLTDLMRQGLGQRMRGEDLDQLVEFLRQLREIGDLALPQGAVQMRETVRHLDELWVALSRIHDITPAVTQGFGDLVGSEAEAWQAWVNRITGHEQTAAEQLAALQSEARVEEAQRALRILELEQRKLELQREAEMLRVRAQLGGLGGEVGRRQLQNQYDELKARVALAAAGKTLAESQLAIAEAQIAAIDELLAALRAIPPIDIEHLKLPRLGGRGGATGSSPADAARDLIRQADLAAMAEWRRSFEEITTKYREAMEPVRKNAALVAELTRAREQEMAALRRQIYDQLRGMSLPPGVGEIEQGRKTFADARALPAGARPPKWLIDLLEGKWLARMTANVDSAIGSMMGVSASVASIRQNAEDLRAQVLALGLSAEETAKRLAEIGLGESFQIESSISGVLDRVFGYLKDSPKYAKQSLDFAKQKVALEFRVIEAQLRALGAWDEATAALVAAAHQAATDAVGGASDRQREIAERLAERQQDAAQRLQDAAEQFAESTKKLIEFRRSLLIDQNLTTLTPQQQIAEALRQYSAIRDRARSGDIDARNNFEQVARQALETYRRAFASADDYQALFQQVLADLNGLIGSSTYALPGASNVVAGAFTSEPTATTASPPSAPAFDARPIVAAIDSHRRQNAGDATAIAEKLDKLVLSNGQMASDLKRFLDRRVA